MPRSQSAIPIIRTKLHRPRIARDLVCRKALHDGLDEGGHQPLTLVSAPAGYGKSTLVSHWLETREGPSAWLSLDETDGDIRTFLRYVVAAVQTAFPEACTDTQVQLEAEGLLPLPVLARDLSNDLDDLEESLVLVLDDYHRINEPGVHELVNHLLEHPPGPLQLVLISRYDPPLSLGTLRAHNDLIEIRTQDLMFKLAETAAFVEQATGQTVSGPALAHLQESTEGWVTGLRLAALALKYRSDADAFLRGFSGDLRTVQDYLIEEVLAQQLPAVQDCLCQTSILNRFCAPLCSAVCIAQSNEGEQTLNGTSFIRFLDDAGMLCVALDEQGEWYRYHHLFQELLQRQLKARLAPDEIRELHRRAVSWFEGQGLLEEAIHHSLQGDGPAEAARLIVRHRNDILNGEQWHRLDLWLNQLPAAVTGDDPELLMLNAWNLSNRGRFPEAFATLDRIAALIDNGAHDYGDTERLRGSIHALRCRQSYGEADGELALEHIERALELLPEDCLAERAYAIVHKVGALQMCGQQEQGHQLIYHLLSDTSVPLGIYQARLLITNCFLDWIAADLPAVRRAANQCLELGEKLGLEETILVGRYFLGIVHYHKNELAEAEAMLLPNTRFKKASNLEYLAESVFALASAHQAQGHADKARDTVRSLCDSLMASRNMQLLQRAEAYEADLALRQGRMAETVNWAQRFDPEPFAPQANFYLPTLTLVKALIAEGGVQSFERAADLLTRLEAFFAGIHNTCFLIQMLALQVTLHDTRGDEPAALEALGRVVSLARPGGFIRLFVDLGPGLARLLNRLELDNGGQRYIGRILSALQGDEQTGAGKVPDHPLTKREFQILELLSDDLSNKQIAEKLCISASTVKRHTENIYHKLDVPDRHKAVAKAMRLAIIRPST